MNDTDPPQLSDSESDDDHASIEAWDRSVRLYESIPSLSGMGKKMREGGPPPHLVPRDRKPIILDTDIGGDPDDAIAVAVAALTQPDLALVVTTDEVGDRRARFARQLLDLMGRHEVPVVSGADLGNDRYFAIEGLPLSEQPIATDVGAAVAQVGTARWVGLGPATNLQAIDQEGLEVTQMGGAFHYRDPSRAEHNFRLDPGAAQSLVRRPGSANLILSDTTFTEEIAIGSRSRIYQGLANSDPGSWRHLLRLHLDQWFARFHPSSIQHDALALSYALRLPFVLCEPARVELDAIGRMSRSEQGAEVWVSTSADYGSFMSWLEATLLDTSA